MNRWESGLVGNDQPLGGLKKFGNFAKSLFPMKGILIAIYF
jgi:hypothetical protein